MVAPFICGERERDREHESERDRENETYCDDDIITKIYIYL